jgi:cardiolipin synthase
MPPPRKLRPFSLPNVLTYGRIAAIPVVVGLLFWPGDPSMRWWALAIYALAGITDYLDGYLARLYQEQSSLGRMLDPIADKLLLTAAYLSLGILKDIPGWLAVVVISRDVLIVTGIAVLTFCGINFAIRPSMISKWTTVVQILTVAVTLLEVRFQDAATLWRVLCWITAGMTVLSGLHYTYIGLHTLQTGYGNQPKNGPE